ncbi:MAG: hypothetical protein IPM96_22020 [Ignavibacteria bacterium]|nr:hypothetical protein [Ignavibacteria bacterium]
MPTAKTAGGVIDPYSDPSDPVRFLAYILLLSLLIIIQAGRIYEILSSIWEIFSSGRYKYDAIENYYQQLEQVLRRILPILIKWEVTVSIKRSDQSPDLILVWSGDGNVSSRSENAS